MIGSHGKPQPGARFGHPEEGVEEMLENKKLYSKLRPTSYFKHPGDQSRSGESGRY